MLIKENYQSLSKLDRVVLIDSNCFDDEKFINRVNLSQGNQRNFPCIMAQSRTGWLLMTFPFSSRGNVSTDASQLMTKVFRIVAELLPL